MQDDWVSIDEQKIKRTDIGASILKYMLPCLFATFLVTSIAADLTKGQVVLNVLGVLNLLLFMACLIVAAGITKITGYALFSAGAFILYHYNVQPGDWLVALRKNSSIITMLTIVPLLGLPLKKGGYLEALNYVYKKFVKSRLGFYLLSTVYSHVLCIILFIGSLPIVYQLQGGKQNDRYKNFMAPAMIRGFSSATLWSANFPAVALILQITGVSWLKVMPVGITLSLTMIIMGFLWEKFINAGETRGGLLIGSGAGETDEDGKRYAAKKISALIAVALAFIVTIYLAELKGSLDLVTVVPIIAVVFSVVWSLMVSGFSTSLIKELWQYMADLSRYKNEVIVFTGAGFFAAAVLVTGFMGRLTSLMQLVVGSNIWLLTYILFLVVLVLSLVGIHPLVAVTTLAVSLDPAGFGVSLDYLASVLICSFSISLLVSPFANIVMITANLFNMSPVELGLRRNGIFAICAMIILGLIINLSTVKG